MIAGGYRFDLPRHRPCTPSLLGANPIDTTVDILIVGAGAAGLMAAIAARGAVDHLGTAAHPEDGAPSVRVIDGSPRVGLKILISGGGRCNVSNEQVSARDYDTDAARAVGHLLKGFPVSSVCTYFESRQCPLYAEPLGKLFPRSDRARDVLQTLLTDATRAGVEILSGNAAVSIARTGSGFAIADGGGATHHARRVIVGTGGKSLPKTGSRGFGLEWAASIGHALEAPVPALVPLCLDPAGPLVDLAGVTVPALLSLVGAGTPPEQVEGRRYRPMARSAGPLLITHDGVSGPAALDVSGACARSLLLGDEIRLEADFLTLTLPESPYRPFLDRGGKPPGASLPPSADLRPSPLERFSAWTAELSASHPQKTLGTALAQSIPRALVERLLRHAGVDPARTVKSTDPSIWRKVHRALVHVDLRLTGTDGYQKAEVTAGGVRLAELHPVTLESRVLAGAYFCGEVCHVTGRLGGFNFQWAWSSGFAAGSGARESVLTTRC